MVSTEIHPLSLHDALPISLNNFGVQELLNTFVNIAPHPVSRHSHEREIRPNEKTFSRSEEHTSELQSRENLVCRLLLEKKKHNCPRTNGSVRRVDRYCTAP